LYGRQPGLKRAFDPNFGLPAYGRGRRHQPPPILRTSRSTTLLQTWAVKKQQQAMEENVDELTQCTLTAAKQHTSLLRTVHVLWRMIALSSVHFSRKYNHEHLFALMIKTVYAVSSQLIARFMASSSKDRTILMLSLLERGVTRTRRRRSMPW
jgi:hypothetical protein